MKRSPLRWLGLGLTSLLVISAWSSGLRAEMDVILGEVIPFSGPDDLELLNDPSNIVYAIDVWGGADPVDRDVKGVLFKVDNGPDPIPGYRTDFEQNVTSWQNRPEYGDTQDDDNLEEIMHHIRWTDNPGGTPRGVHFEVEPYREYTLQLLISGNHDENREWDIFIEGGLVVDEFDSIANEAYDVGISYAYTRTMIAPDAELNVTFNAGSTTGDNNGILQGAILATTGRVLTPGDFNTDDTIDTADFQILLSNFHNTGASYFDGDINLDTTIDLHDFVSFRAAYLAANPAEGAVPEPAGLLPLIYAGSLLLAFYRHRRPNKR
jgi:hypothetical protein